MRVFKSLRLKGVPWFKEQEFDLSKPGITVILGKNLNTPTASTNAAGKSYFFSFLPEVILDEIPGDNRKDRPRKGRVELDVVVDKHQYTIVKDFAHVSKSRIEKDGVDLGIKDVAERKAFISKLIGRTPIEYQTLDYIDSTNIRNHPLVKGDTAQRKGFFTEFFKLDNVDVLRKLIKDEIASVNETAAVLAELKVQRKELQADLLEDPDGVKRRLKEVTSELKNTSEKLDSLSDAIQFSAYVSANADALEACSKRNKELESGSIEERLREAKRTRKRLEAFEEYKADLKLWKVSVERRRQYLLDNPELEDVDDVENRLESAQSKLESARDENARMKLESQKRESRLESLRDKLSVLQDTLDGLDEQATCSKCGQPVTKKHAKQERQALDSEIQEMRKSIKSLSKSEEPPLVDLTKLNSKVETLRELAERVRRIPVVQEKPVKPDDIPDQDLDKVEAEIKRLSVLLDCYQQVQGNPSFYKRYLKGEEPERDCKRLQAKLLDSYDTLTTKSHDYKFKLDTHSKTEAKLEALKEKMRLAKAKVADLDVLKLLEKAYTAGTGGLKSLAIQTICDKMAQKTNQYAPLIFPEDYRFSFELGTQFSILVTRTYKGEQITTDVRKLSGAESSMCSLLFLIVLLTFVPKAKRSNSIILDEPNANFGQEMTEALIRFLPVLNKVIPHIIVITPHSEHDYGESARYFTVVKKGNNSKIFKGAV